MSGVAYHDLNITLRNEHSDKALKPPAHTHVLKGTYSKTINFKEVP
jgi:hypothetical protein